MPSDKYPAGLFSYPDNAEEDELIGVRVRVHTNGECRERWICPLDFAISRDYRRERGNGIIVFRDGDMRTRGMCTTGFCGRVLWADSWLEDAAAAAVWREVDLFVGRLR